MEIKHVFLTARNPIRLGLVLAALGGVSLSQAQDTSKALTYFTTSGGTQIWAGPGFVVKKDPGINWQRVFDTLPSNGGTALRETGPVALQNGAKVALTSTRVMTAANVFKATRALAGGPVGLALLVGMPLFQAWVNQENTRIGTGVGDKPFEIMRDNCGAAGCYEFKGQWGQQWHTSRTAAAEEAFSKFRAAFGMNVQTQPCVLGDGGQLPAQPGNFTCAYTNQDGSKGSFQGGFDIRNSAEAPGWVPASMSDIEPYLAPRPTPAAYPEKLINAGGEIESTRTGTSGPSTAPAEPPVTKTTQVPTPPPSTTSRQTPGNPHNIPSNTPTVTSQSTGSTPTTVNGKPVNQPNQTTTTSTYDPDANKTTDTTTTTHTPIRVEETTTNGTNITYNTNQATATTTNTTVTNIINNITNNVINTTSSGGDVKPTEPQEQKDMCVENPDILACAKPELDTPDGDIPKETKTITYTPENTFGDGACPANAVLNSTLLHGQVTVWDWQKTCSYALPLRALVLALATFAAFLIVMPGSERV